MRVESVLDLIGSTPLVGIHSLSPNKKIKIYLKLEGQNPAGSIKDRVALSLIDDAEQSGRLKPGGTVLESSSGNTGIGLAMVCRIRKYRLVIILAENVTKERVDLLRSFGADIIFSPGEQGSNGAIRCAQEISEEHPDWVYLYQYGNEANVRAHETTTAPEILNECPEVSAVVAGLGTSGTLMGISRYMREHKPGVDIIAVEPPTGESVSGLRSIDDGYIPEILDSNAIDRKIMIRSHESIEMTRRLLNECGLFVGVSTGAVVAGAMKQAINMTEGTIVVVSPDAGWKYLSAEIWSDDVDDVIKTSEKINFW